MKEDEGQPVVHEFEQTPFDGTTCGKMIYENGGGHSCGLPASAPVHRTLPEQSIDDERLYDTFTELAMQQRESAPEQPALEECGCGRARIVRGEGGGQYCPVCTSPELDDSIPRPEQPAAKTVGEQCSETVGQQIAREHGSEFELDRRELANAVDAALDRAKREQWESGAQVLDEYAREAATKAARYTSAFKDDGTDSNYNLSLEYGAHATAFSRICRCYSER